MIRLFCFDGIPDRAKLRTIFTFTVAGSMRILRNVSDLHGNSLTFNGPKFKNVANIEEIFNCNAF